MGNTLQGQQDMSNKNKGQSGNICDMSNQLQNSIRCSFADNLADNANVPQYAINPKQRDERAHKSLDGRNKQKLSLSKQAQSQSSMRLHLKRSASNDCRGIGLTQAEKTVSEYRPVMIINCLPPKMMAPQTEQRISKAPIRPRDLPRRISSEKVIVFPQSTIKRVPLEPRIIINPPPTSSPCIISYVRNSDVLSNSHHSLQSSVVTPFVPLKTSVPNNLFIQNSQQPKKLKKVAMNRSHTNYNNFERGENNGQQSEINKQNEKKGKGQSLLVESRFNDETTGQQLFTDPKLYTYITNKEHPCAKEIKNKYAIPTSDDKFQTKRSNIFLNKKDAPISIRPMTNAPQRLEDAIPDEVESKPFIQGDMFRFPTLTEFSEDSKTDNTSFIPLRSTSSQKPHLEGQELLKYCRPKIDEMVMADLQRLPVKN